MTDQPHDHSKTSGPQDAHNHDQDSEQTRAVEAKVAADHAGHDHKAHGHEVEAISQEPGGHAGHDHSAHEKDDGCCSTKAAAPGWTPVKVASSTAGTTTAIRIMQMDCATEETLIDNKLGGMKTVKGLNFNLMQRVLTVVHEPAALDGILEAIRSLGFKPEVLDQATASEGISALAPEPAKPWWPLALAGVAAIASEAVDWMGMPEAISAVLAFIAVGVCGWPVYKKGWIAIANLNLNINALMSIAVTGAMILRQWPEAAMVMVLFAISELIEAKSMDRARNAIQGLMSLTSETATVKQADGSWKEIDVKDVALDAIVRVKPGERIGLDGAISNGRSTINQAPITGESLPVDKGEGDQVFAGTINESGSFEYKVTAAAGNTTLAKIIRAVESAQGAKAPTQRFVDQFSRIYTPIVFAIALAVAILPPLFMGGDWMAWIYKALVLLVIACPCALVISTPVTIVSGLATAAKNGILVKGGVYLEEGRKLKWLALDKTGTITHGKPVQTDFVALADGDPQRYRELAAGLASRSDHPVSQAVAKKAAEEGVKLPDVADFEALPGKGTKGRIDNTTYHLGNHRLTHERGLCSPELEARLTELEKSGKTVIVLTDDKTVLALFAVADTVKQSSRVAIAELHELGVKTVMLTGDNVHTAQAIAKEVGIDEALGDQLPEDKLEAIKKFAKDGKIGMVGDGINDAPALAQADVGFAMGAMGTDTAIETADVALMDDDLRKIGVFVRLSRKTRAILVQNISFALGLKAVFLVITLAGLGTMWMAVFADVGASLLVVANGLRLLRRVEVAKSPH
ncbi:heavy metal translocating P-type ATPase [Asticcacaulis sp. AC460]|uniref:heavy metal translocating P-type ATPase n=1 Tax=Asticcacaulis sp. AC460 TaxID=1282360 RepID=UPI0009DD16E6|nr:heavy metal translocating P-type ATPase [Asticcacaulis sp. AC460]